MKKAKLVGYNDKNETVLEEIVEVDDEQDQSTLWNDARAVIKLGMSLLKGQLYDEDGDIYEEFEKTFDPQSGEEIICKNYSDTGGIDTNGIYD